MLIVACDAHWGIAGFFRVVLSRGSGGCGELSAQGQHRWEESGEGVLKSRGVSAESRGILRKSPRLFEQVGGGK